MPVNLRQVKLSNLPASDRRQILRRSAVADPVVRQAAEAICADVKQGGDGAVGPCR